MTEISLSVPAYDRAVGVVAPAEGGTITIETVSGSVEIFWRPCRVPGPRADVPGAVGPTGAGWGAHPPRRRHQSAGSRIRLADARSLHFSVGLARHPVTATGAAVGPTTSPAASAGVAHVHPVLLVPASSNGSRAPGEHPNVHQGHERSPDPAVTPGQSLDQSAPPGTRTPNPRIKRVRSW